MELEVVRTFNENYIYGAQEIELTENEHLKIKSPGNDTNILDVQVPAMKKWKVVITVQIYETNAL